MTIALAALAEIYISVVVKTSGPVPGLYAMAAVGAVVVGGVTTTGELVAFPRTHEQIFYKELQPLSGQTFAAEALNGGALKNFVPDEHATPAQEAEARWRYLKDSGELPRHAMLAFSDFVVDAEARFHAPAVFMGYPAGFDWMFVHHYFHSQKIKPPFGFSRMLDLKSAYSIATQSPLTASVRSRMYHRIGATAKVELSAGSQRADDEACAQGLMGLEILKMVYGEAEVSDR